MMQCIAVVADVHQLHEAQSGLVKCIHSKGADSIVTSTSTHLAIRYDVLLCDKQFFRIVPVQ
jgi:hypothetical protein